MRRFLGRPSTAWAIGVVLPLAMLLLDPTVFRGGEGMRPFLGGARPFGYAAIAAGMALTAVDLLSRRGKAAVAGALAAAALFSAGLGLLLLPLSAIGLLAMGIGLLGFSPFLCAAVLGYRACSAFGGAPLRHRTAHAALGFGLFFIGCAGTQSVADGVWDRAVAEIRSDDPRASLAGAERLRRWSVLLDADGLADAWRAEPDLAKKERIAAAYLRLTGRSLEYAAD